MDDDPADDGSVEIIDQVADDESVHSGEREDPLEDENVPFDTGNCHSRHN